MQISDLYVEVHELRYHQLQYTRKKPIAPLLENEYNYS